MPFVQILLKRKNKSRNCELFEQAKLAMDNCNYWE